MEAMDPRDLQQLEELCVQDELPFCQAACPLHVDVRAMMTAMAAGDLAGAARLFQKRATLPNLLARICDQPCLSFCKRGEAGGPINIGLLERFLAEQQGFPVEGLHLRSTKLNRVAIVGSGMSGLTAAIELAKKNYSVTLFEAENVLGGQLRSLSRSLPSEVLDRELKVLDQLGVEVRTGLRLFRDVTLASLLTGFDAVFLAIGAGSWTDAPLDVNPATLATNTERLFFGGSARTGACPYSPVTSMTDGKRAAISIERLLKGESVDAHRDKEGPVDTRLFTSIANVEPAAALPPGGPNGRYLPAEAQAEAARCLHCECLECVKVCDYLRHFNEYPGKCIRKVTKNIVSHPGKSLRTHTKVINACTLCGLCGSVCPTDLDMGFVNTQARMTMCERSYMPPAIHEAAIQDMESSNQAPYSFARHQPGHSESAYLFFPGCQLAASSPGNTERAYGLLCESLGGGVGLALRCCGAPALWSGRRALFESLTNDFKAIWEDLGRPTIILACPTCQLMFARELPDMPAASLWEILDSVPLPEGASRGGGSMINVHDACTARFAGTVQDSVRRVIVKLGYEVEELKYSRQLTRCCGYGGLQYQVNPGLTKKFIDTRIAESTADFVTYCTNCRDFFSHEGKAAHHLLDLVFGQSQVGEPARRGPSFSQRRDNRRYLARKLLKELWGESLADEPAHLSVELKIAPELAATLEKKYILTEDLQRVIHWAEETGNKLYMPGTSHFIAHLRPSIITFWVEYAPHDGTYEVFNAYSHRMKIVEDANHG